MLYEYWCENCQERYERQKPMADRLTDVHDCGSDADLRPSVFRSINGHPFFRDGEGFVSQIVPKGTKPIDAEYIKP